MSATSGSAAIISRRVGYVDAAAYLGISVLALRSMVSRKRVPHIRLSAKCVVFDLQQLDAWLAARTVEVQS